MSAERMYLSSPDVGEDEERLLLEALRSGWIAPLGPQVDAFEEEFAAAVGVRAAACMNSGTAALHLALLLAGVEAGDEVLVSTLTFAGSVNPIVYLGAEPIFVDSESVSWNLDPALVAEAVERKVREGRPPAAVVVVHLYGQTADMDPIAQVCAPHGIPLVEDAAEALGARYRGRSAGSVGRIGIFSFNGNKVITTSGGGMLVSDDEALVAKARKLASQAREPAPHYEHKEIGYNYRLSNLLAAVGRAQLGRIDALVEARQKNFAFYEEALGDLPGLAFTPEAPWGHHTRWLTTLTIDPAAAGVDRERARLALEEENIESRPVWKPMHLQPVFAGCEFTGDGVAADLFERGLCLPSGSNLTEGDLVRVVDTVRNVWDGR